MPKQGDAHVVHRPDQGTSVLEVEGGRASSSPATTADAREQGLEQGMSEDQYTMQIEGAKAEIVGPDPDAPGLLQIRMSLWPLADLAWCEIFDEMPPGLSHSLILHPPLAGSTEITGKTPDQILEDYVVQ